MLCSTMGCKLCAGLYCYVLLHDSMRYKCYFVLQYAVTTWATFKGVQCDISEYLTKLPMGLFSYFHLTHQYAHELMNSSTHTHEHTYAHTYACVNNLYAAACFHMRICAKTHLCSSAMSACTWACANDSSRFNWWLRFLDDCPLPYRAPMRLY
jgi:hypothetical protein